MLGIWGVWRCLADGKAAESEWKLIKLYRTKWFTLLEVRSSAGKLKILNFSEALGEKLNSSRREVVHSSVV